MQGSWAVLSSAAQGIALGMTQRHPSHFLAPLLPSRGEQSDRGLNFPITESVVCLSWWEAGGHLGFSKGR